MGAVHQGPRDAAPDAALAHRQVGGRAALQERHVAQRRPDRDHRPLGGRRRARRRPARPAAAEEAPRREHVAGRDGRLRRAGPGDQVARLHDAGQAPGRLVPADERHPDLRAAVGEDGRDPPVEPGQPQDSAPFHRVPRAQRRPRRGEHGDGQRPHGAADARGPGEPPPAADGMGHRQGLRPLPRGHGQADRPWREDLVGPAPPRGR